MHTRLPSRSPAPAGLRPLRPAGLLAALLLAATACSEHEISAPAAPSPPEYELAAANAAPLGNGVTVRDSLTAAGQTRSWTFTASTGNYVSVAIGEVSGTADFTPWIRLVAPNGTVVGNAWNVAAAQIGLSAPQTGSYTIIVGSADSGNDGKGSYRLTRLVAPGALTVSTGDQGGGITNGATKSGSLYVGDQDYWTISANTGDYLAVNVGEVSGTADFTPWIRLVAPNGALVGNAWNVAAAQISLNATQTGTYRILVGSADSGNDGSGSYQLTVAKAPGTSTVSTGDQGGALKNGADQGGALYVGDVDAWKFSAATGNYISVSVGEVSGTADFTPWIRLVAPNGALVGNAWNVAAAQISVNATQTGTYTVIVGTADSGNDASGKYKLRLAKAPGTPQIATGDQGGSIANGSNRSGKITVGDTDPWTFTAATGHYIAVSVGEVSGTADFTPWIRLVAPNGALVGNAWNVAAAQISVNATQTGTYTVIVGTADSGNDGTGQYSLRLAEAPDSFVVPTGDEGGSLAKGVASSGTIAVGDLDQWSFRASAGGSISLNVTELSGSADFTPWIRLVAPNGTLVGNSWGVSSATINLASATQTGKYRVIVGTADSGNDATGTYRLTVNGTGVVGQ